jgi:hypothetical protein
MSNKNDECVELKNIKYQTMLMNKKMQTPQTENSTINIEKFLQNERTQVIKKPWSKLEKTIKRKKLYKVAETYNTKHKEMLKQYLFHCLERKKLQRTKDVIYDITTGKIEKIPGLSFNKNSNKYTLRRIDKKGSTLKSHAPKKKRKTNTH